MITLYNVVSEDGFIARPDGSEDFIPDEMWPRFLDMCKKYGAVILGRKTYETIQEYPPALRDSFNALAIQKIVVTSNRSLGLNPEHGYIAAHSPEDAIALAPDALVVSGPTLNNYLLEHGLVGKIILQKVAGKIGEGLRPFDEHLAELIPTDYLN